MKDELITRLSGVKGGEDIRAVSYDLFLFPDLLSRSPTISYSGAVQTRYIVDEDNESSTISFHAEDLERNSLYGRVSDPNDPTRVDLTFTEVMFDFQTTIVKLVANESFPPG